MASTTKSGVNIYYNCSDGSVIKQSYADVNINSNSTDFANAIASINGALVQSPTIGGSGWFENVWYKDKDSNGTTDTKIISIACVQEETTVTNDVYGTRPQ